MADGGSAGGSVMVLCGGACVDLDGAGSDVDVADSADGVVDGFVRVELAD